MSKNTERNTKQNTNNPRPVFLLTDGPTVRMNVRETAEGFTYERMEIEEFLLHELTGEVRFQMFAGWLGRKPFIDDRGLLEIAPVLLRPLSICVKVRQSFIERNNPDGVTIVGWIEELMDYGGGSDYLYVNNKRIPVMKKGDLICASYNIVDGTGGFVRVESAFREDFQPSLANSRTGVHCIYHREVEGDRRFGRGVYKLHGTADTCPIEY